METTPIRSDLQVLDLRTTQVDLAQVNNRRFMYHPSGILILGAEDMVSSKKLASSHAEEHGIARDQFGTKIPPFDEFTRGWIGRGGAYRNGIIHFAPHVTGAHLPYFNASFDFIEVALRNGFSHKAILRGFCEPWEQPISKVIPEPAKPKLSDVMKDASARSSQMQYSKPEQGRGGSQPER